MNKTSQPMFPSDSQREQWLDRNCRQCRRSVRPKMDGRGKTASTCKIFDDIESRRRNPDAEVAYRSCRTVLVSECPYRHHLRIDDDSLSLFG